MLGPMSRPQVYSLFVPENLGLPDHQVVYFPVGFGNIVGHAAGAVGDILRLFKDDDIHLRHGSFGPAGSTHAGSIAPDDHEFHKPP